MTEHTQPPEGYDPPKCDPVDLDTAIGWQDKIKELLDHLRRMRVDKEDQSLAVFDAIIALNMLHTSISETIDDCHGLNDPEPEQLIDEDKMKALQHKERS